jgi:hypothetical protein
LSILAFNAQRGECWEASRRRAACLHQPRVFRVWCARAARLIRPLACRPGVRDEPPQGPPCCPEHPGMGEGGTAGRSRRGHRRQART